MTYQESRRQGWALWCRGCKREQCETDEMKDGWDAANMVSLVGCGERPAEEEAWKMFPDSAKAEAEYAAAKARIEAKH